MNHTPGLLAVIPPDRNSDRWFICRAAPEVTGAKKFYITVLGTRESADAGIDEADALHLVACWNACEGINPESVPDLLGALKTAQAELFRLTAYHDEQPSESAINIVTAAIVEATP